MVTTACIGWTARRLMPASWASIAGGHLFSGQLERAIPISQQNLTCWANLSLHASVSTLHQHDAKVSQAAQDDEMAKQRRLTSIGQASSPAPVQEPQAPCLSHELPYQSTCMVDCATKQCKQILNKGASGRVSTWMRGFGMRLRPRFSARLQTLLGCLAAYSGAVDIKQVIA